MKRLLVVALIMLPLAAHAEENAEPQRMAKAAQNPLTAMVSLPFQYNWTPGMQPYDQTYSVLNIQPVIPFGLGDDWNLITRTILPVTSLPDGLQSINGLGATSFTGWFSPSRPWGHVTWGVGPVASIPTNTDPLLGPGQWGAGASVVGVYMKGKWVAGGLVNNVWGLSNTEEFNTFLFQYFVNYNIDKGWYLVTAPIISADWNADAADRWIVPVGAGIGKLIPIAGRPVNMNLHAYYNLDTPVNHGDWTYRFQVQFMFPK